MKFAKGGEQNFSTEVFRITNVIERQPRTVYVLEDFNQKPIEGQFYGEELTPIRIFKQTTYVGGSISFRPDIQRPRQMQNALRDI